MIREINYSVVTIKIKKKNVMVMDMPEPGTKEYTMGSRLWKKKSGQSVLSLYNYLCKNSMN